MLAGHEQHAVLGAHPLDHVERAQRLAVLHKTDGAGLRRVPAERVPEALEPALEHRVVGVEYAAGTLEEPCLLPRLQAPRSGVATRPRLTGVCGVLSRPRLR